MYTPVLVDRRRKYKTPEERQEAERARDRHRYRENMSDPVERKKLTERSLAAYYANREKILLRHKIRRALLLSTNPNLILEKERLTSTKHRRLRGMKERVFLTREQRLEKGRERSRIVRIKSKCRITAYERARHKKDSDTLSNRYVGRAILKASPALRVVDIPITLIEAKRKQLCLNRTINQKGVTP